MKSVLLVALSLSLFAGSASVAAPAFYRCKDEKGKGYFSNSKPAECEGRDTEVLNEKGSVIEVIESEATRAKTLAREAEEAKRLKERNDQLQRDRVLLETYLTVADLERLRDQRMELLQAQLRVAEQHVVQLQDRLGQLRQQSARFKPYNEAPNAPALPDHIAEALINTVNSIRVDHETVAGKRKEQVDLAASFERDIKRFKELKAFGK